MPTYGEVQGEGGVRPLAERAKALPHPAAAADAQPRELDRLALGARALSRGAGRDARRDDPPPSPSTDRLLVDHGRVTGVRTGDKGRGREGEPLQETQGPRMGCQRSSRYPQRARRGTSRTTAIDRFGLHARLAELGARGEGGVEGREAADQGHPHAGLAAARDSAPTASSGVRGSTRWATGMVSIGFVVGLD